MNRLVIVGNGFDLAYGLKTSYEDFLVDYFNGIFALKDEYNDELISVRYNPKSNFHPKEIEEFETIEELSKSTRIHKELQKGKTAFHNGIQYIIYYKSKFFKQLLINRNWTDIESNYFRFLLSEYENEKVTANTSSIQDLNKQFECLKMKLGEYLKKVDNNIVLPGKRTATLDVLDGVFDKIKSDSHQSKFGYTNLGDIAPFKVFFMNFNYTSLLKKYIELLSDENRKFTTYLPIHGTVENSESIIFGYGDETHEQYKYLENQDKDELLENIKSFYYPAEPYYQELMDFINYGDFDVYVLGHSLGLSDRVLLKTIFENDYCKAIKLFHRGSEASQFKKRIAISRHFDNKIAMRNKILHFDPKDVFGV